MHANIDLPPIAAAKQTIEGVFKTENVTRGNNLLRGPLKVTFGEEHVTVNTIYSCKCHQL